MNRQVRKGNTEMQGDRHEAHVGVAHILELARAANVEFDMVEGRLILRSSHVDWNLWSPLRRCLDAIGIDAIAGYFASTTPADRLRLAELPPPPAPRHIDRRFSLQ